METIINFGRSLRKNEAVDGESQLLLLMETSCKEQKKSIGLKVEEQTNKLSSLLVNFQLLHIMSQN